MAELWRDRIVAVRRRQQQRVADAEADVRMYRTLLALMPWTVPVRTVVTPRRVPIPAQRTPSAGFAEKLLFDRPPQRGRPVARPRAGGHL